MTLAKASIKPTDPAGDEIRFGFNPTQYTLEASNQLAEIGVPGLRAPVVQFVRGGSRTLNLDLLFDSYGTPGADVADATERIYGLLEPAASTGAPPICVFVWRARRFRCVVERVSGRFTLFRGDGAPVRATLTVMLREYAEAGVAVRREGAAVSARAGTRVVAQGDTLSGIAQAVYGDAARWREIAAANGVINPARLEPGTLLMIPPGTGA